MGALEYEPAQKLGNKSTFSINVQRLYEFAKQVLNQRETTVLNQENTILWQDLVKISSFPGGKRAKGIIALNKDTGDVISGQGLIPEGFQHYIFKYDDNSVYPSAKLEYVYYRMALDAGIDMMPLELRNYGNIVHFLTQHFDRVGNTKIHTQTLSAMWQASDSYEDIFAVIRRLNLPYENSRQHYIRMAFNVIARNVDDHSKNFSFCMNQKGIWRLSPAYANRHLLTINGKNEDITRKDLKTVGLNNDIQDYKTLIDTVADAVVNFDKYATELDVDKKLIKNIKSDFVGL